MASLTASTKSVNFGIVISMPAKTSLNLGTTNVISRIKMPLATISTATG